MNNDSKLLGNDIDFMFFAWKLFVYFWQLSVSPVVKCLITTSGGPFRKNASAYLISHNKEVYVLVEIPWL